MEDQLKQMKSQLLKGELADFEFTPQMKQGVLRKMNHKKSLNIHGLVHAGLGFILAGVFFAGLYFLVDSNYTNEPGLTSPPRSAAHGQDEKPELIQPGYIPEPPAEEQPVNEGLSEEAAIDLLVKYEEKTRSFNSDRDNLKYNNLHTKEEYYQSFSDLMTRETAVKLFESRLEEKDDGLYAVATEFPVFYSEKYPYTYSKVNESQYVLSQTFSEGLYSGITATFNKIDQKWLISNIEVK